VATDTSGLKGIGGVYNDRIFSSRVPSHHHVKHINWKEMFAILHALIIWHKEWVHGSVDVACDNTAVVNGINNRSIRGPAVHPLHTILLIAAVFDIEIKAHWIPSEENVIADVAS
jgi:ribonuclease HI